MSEEEALAMFDVELTSLERKIARDVLEEYRADLRAKKNPPKGWSYGNVQDALSALDSICKKLG